MPLIGSRETVCPNCKLAVVDSKTELCPHCGEELYHEGDFKGLFRAITHGLRTLLLFTVGGVVSGAVLGLLFIAGGYILGLEPMVGSNVLVLILLSLLDIMLFVSYGTLTGFSLGMSRGLNLALKEANAISLIMDQVFARSRNELGENTFIDNGKGSKLRGKECVAMTTTYDITSSSLRDVIHDEYGSEDVSSLGGLMKKFFMGMALSYLFKTLLRMILKRQRRKDRDERWVIPLEKMEQIAEIGTGRTLHRMLIRPINIVWGIATPVFIILCLAPFLIARVLI